MSGPHDNPDPLEEGVSAISVAIRRNPKLAQVPSQYRRTPNPTHQVEHNLLGTFVELARDYKAIVEVVSSKNVSKLLYELTEKDSQKSLIMPESLLQDLQLNILDDLRTHFDLTMDDPKLNASQISQINASLTGASAAAATTGSIILNNPVTDGRRIISLVVDYHYCLLRASYIKSSFTEAMAMVNLKYPITVVSGPSATSDIELSRVEGVHGPRKLRILVLEDR
ncbi:MULTISPECIES: LUD domain-containing protein [Acidithrix]|uniref:Lactate utilization protein C n=1 Tax=Acidithrix ferrooxidans TaxID=1280514 RepID=A0A0D8HEJ5_9ACTN|nr:MULTISPECIES: LUD domain-containing protein [Acidithrix]ATZ76165.1 L-lactate utilization protein C [uncultured Acidithrix sp.]KJF16365.1 lactate utilization protein C [Acidithrix ferrooxidans]CAG4913703.1 unnamed protein product [Acidithrix sp. C25]